MPRDHDSLKRVALAAAMGLGALLLVPSASVAVEPQCLEQPGPSSPTPRGELAELQANPNRPTFVLPLDDKKSLADDISLPLKTGAATGKRPIDVSAAIPDGVRRKQLSDRRLKGEMRVAASASPDRPAVVVSACVERAGVFSAGKFEGTIDVFGPRLSGFSYPLVVTTKWPWWFAAGLLLVVIGGFLLIAWGSGSFTFKVQDKRRRWAGTLVGIAIAVGAAALTYWSVYVSNETWGDNPAVQLPGLAVAAYTAGVGGLATAKGLFSSG